ncbi:undecaprenyldiphospho-muramoylpentapeptide beta-N-acetylglucosaminyltransferase [candidate division KSB1 bacterium]|nr:undecaprenyldiphospho-muramoylpentapeptide beta-N-acetylglucosaminyltransferase [candidate division KSB1 bacterium]
MIIICKEILIPLSQAQRKNPQIVFAAGGTAGHLYPALTIAAELKKRFDAAEIHFIGTPKGIESRVVPSRGYPLHFISVRGFKRGSVLQNIAVIFRLVSSLIHSLVLLYRIKPQVCIGTGGYASGPVMFMATLLKIPTCIQEQNSYPGLTTRLLAGRVDRVFVAYDSVINHLQSADNVSITGNPVRKMDADIESGQARQHFKIDKGPVLLVFGGSQGARIINDTMIAILDRLLSETRIQILWSCGEKNWPAIEDKIGQTDRRVRLYPYIDEMDKAYAAGDLAICRAGALTLAELALCRLPAVLIPLKIAAENHQEYNARVMEKHNAAVVITEAELNSNLVYNTIIALIQDQDRLRKMRAALKEMARPDAGEKIVDVIMQII